MICRTCKKTIRFRIERLDGSTDGLGDAVLFESKRDAWRAAERAFSSDPASDGPDGIYGWLIVREVGHA